MNEKDLTKICLAVSLAGILLIYIADVGYSPQKMKGSDITAGLAGEVVTLCGKILDVKTSESGTVFFKIDDGTKTDAVLFKNRATRENLYGLNKGNELCVTGDIEQYRGKMEIIAAKIREA